MAGWSEYKYMQLELGVAASQSVGSSLGVNGMPGAGLRSSSDVSHRRGRSYVWQYGVTGQSQLSFDLTEYLVPAARGRNAEMGGGGVRGVTEEGSPGFRLRIVAFDAGSPLGIWHLALHT